MKTNPPDTHPADRDQAPLPQALARPVADDPPAPRDCVDEAGDASFPASDPPSWWSGA